MWKCKVMILRVNCKMLEASIVMVAYELEMIEEN